MFLQKSTPFKNFKRRTYFFRQVKLFKKTSNYNVCTKKTIKINLKFFFFFKKTFKKLFRKNKIISFLYFFPNKWLSKKIKNSRMGKGVGKSYKLYFQCKSLTKLIFFKNINVRRIFFLKKILERYFNSKFYICRFY